MGGRTSKGPVRRDIRPWIPLTWEQLQAMERWILAQKIYFIEDKKILKEWFKKDSEIDEAIAERNECFQFPICVHDLLAGFCLVQKVPSYRRFEFIAKLLRNGNRCNRTELLIAIQFGVRGIAKLKGSKPSPDHLLRMLVLGVFGSAHEMDWTEAIDKLLLAPDVVYFLNDLDMVMAETLEHLIIDQRDGLKALAKVEYDMTIEEMAMEETNDSSEFDHIHEYMGEPIGTFLGIATTQRSKTATRKRKHLQGVDKFCQRIHAAFAPEKKPNGSKQRPSTGSRNLERMKQLKTVDFISLLHTATDGAFELSTMEAEEILQQFPRDQLERISCSDVIRWFKSYVNEKNDEIQSKWYTATKNLILFLKNYFNSWNKKLKNLKKKNYKIKEKKEIELLDELNFSLLIHIKKNETIELSEIEENGKLGIRIQMKEIEEKIKLNHTKEKTNEIFQLTEEDDEEDNFEPGFPMVYRIELLLSRDINDESAMAIAKSMDRFLNDFNVLKSFSFFYQKATVDIKYGYHEFSTQNIRFIASDKFYIQICFYSHHNLFNDFEEIFQEKINFLFRAFRFDIQLNQSLQDLIQFSTKNADLFQKYFYSKDISSFVKCIFNKFDIDKNNELSLSELNLFQQEIKKPIINSIFQLNEIIKNNSINKLNENINLNGFISTFLKFGGLLKTYTTLGIGSLNDILSGTISIATTIDKNILKNIQNLFSKNRWKNITEKWFYFLFQQFRDGSFEFHFTTIHECLEFLWPQHGNIPLIQNTGWFYTFLQDFDRLFWHQHQDHTENSICYNLICAARQALHKFNLHPQKGSHEIVLRYETLGKCIEMYDLIENSICGIQEISLYNKTIQFQIEFKHFLILKKK